MLPEKITEIIQYLPKEADFEAVFKAKQNGDTSSLRWYPHGEDAPYYYPTIRVYLAAILLRWEELGKKVEKQLFEGKYDWVNKTRIRVPYYTAKELAQIRGWAMRYKENFKDAYLKFKDASTEVESPERVRQAARDARKGEIEVKIKDINSVVRIIPYSMKYGDVNPNKKQVGVKMHIFFSKEISPGNYNITVRGSTIFGDTKNPVYDQPYFLNEQEARNFIANFNHNTVKTRVTLEDWRFVITDRPMEDGYSQNVDGSYMKKYYMPNKSELTKVDTVCGPCYMLKEARDAYYAWVAARKK